MKPLSPSSQPSPLKGEGGSGSFDPIAKGTSPEGEGVRPSPKGNTNNKVLSFPIGKEDNGPAPVDAKATRSSLDGRFLAASDLIRASSVAASLTSYRHSP